MERQTMVSQSVWHFAFKCECSAITSASYTHTEFWKVLAKTLRNGPFGNYSLVFLHPKPCWPRMEKLAKYMVYQGKAYKIQSKSW